MNYSRYFLNLMGITTEVVTTNASSVRSNDLLSFLQELWELTRLNLGLGVDGGTANGG